MPAKISNIQKLSENLRLVSVFLARTDLNKRDLLRGDRSLNGLGERSEAVVAIKSESAFAALRTVIGGYFEGAVPSFGLHTTTDQNDVPAASTEPENATL